MPRAQAQDRINHIAQDLIENHECDHEHWDRVNESHMCGFCDEYMPVFIFECNRCHQFACQRCMMNRL